MKVNSDNETIDVSINLEEIKEVFNQEWRKSTTIFHFFYKNSFIRTRSRLIFAQNLRIN